MHIDPQLSQQAEFHEGLAQFERDGKTGFIDPAGKIVSEPQWDFASEFANGLAAVNRKGKCGRIDRMGKIIIPPESESLDDSPTLIAFEQKKRFGFLGPDWSYRNLSAMGDLPALSRNG